VAFSKSVWVSLRRGPEEGPE